jgi:hypothetical protein
MNDVPPEFRSIIGKTTGGVIIAGSRKVVRILSSDIVPARDGFQVKA